MELRGGAEFSESMIDEAVDENAELLESATYTVPSESVPDLFYALQLLKNDTEKHLEGNNVFVKKGIHNLTTHGDVEVDWEVHLMGESGTVVAGWAEPTFTSPVPSNGGGRWRLTAGATGSTFRRLRWRCFNAQCVIVASSAVLFQVFRFVSASLRVYRDENARA